MKKKLSYIDIFAGCGGFSLGLLNSNYWQGIFAIEKNEDAFKTLKHNLIKNKKHFDWPNWLSKKNLDIHYVLNEYRVNLKRLQGHVDLVVGGPPCQGFSFAGKRKESDERNKLVLAYLDFIKLIKPKFLLFENVKGFDTGFKKNNGERNTAYSKIVINKLIQLGYSDASHQIINFSDFGVPQNRNRVIIAASLNNTSNKFFTSIVNKKSKYLKQKGLKIPIKLKDAIGDLERKNGTIQSKEFKNFKEGIYPKNNKLSEYQKLMREQLEKILPDSHRFANHTLQVEEKFSDIIKNNLSSAEIRIKYKTKKTNTKLLRKDQVCPTLTTLPDDYVHYSEPRILTVREYARIQSFPDWYEFKGRYTTGGSKRKIEVPRYTQVGNAVSPLFSEFCGLAIKEVLNG